jgi:translation initiation factor 2 gamma subunit (eIF-2gamma)
LVKFGKKPLVDRILPGILAGVNTVGDPLLLAIDDVMLAVLGELSLATQVCDVTSLVWSLIGGYGIGCPPLVKFGKKPLVDRILPGIL